MISFGPKHPCLSISQDEILLKKLLLKRAELRDLWEGEDGFNSRKSEREEEIVKESWDDGEDTNVITKAPEQVVKKDFVNTEKESTTETKPKKTRCAKSFESQRRQERDRNTAKAKTFR